jgi:CHASE3 domain sensor protein
VRLTFTPAGLVGRILFGFGALALLGSGLFSYLGQSWNAVFFEAMRLQTNQVLEQTISRDFEQGRFSLWQYVATGDEESYRRAQRAFSLAEDRVKDLQSRTFSPDRRERLDQLAASLSSYEGLAAHFQEIKGSNANVGSSEFRPLVDSAISLGNQLENQGDALSSAYERAASDQMDYASDLTSGTVRLMAWIGFIAIVVGAALSLRWRRPRLPMTAAAE